METEWLQTPLGQSLLAAEQDLLRPVLEGVFGEAFVQVGRWGAPDLFTTLARTQRTLVAGQNATAGVDVALEPEQLPFLTDSVDVMLLPHTLDYCLRPHATLREASRVLRSDGQLLIMGFKPGGLWGARRLAPGKPYPPDTVRMIPQRRLTDWLELLDLRILERHRFFFKLPRQSGPQVLSEAWQRRGERFWPELAACYMLRAQKRLRTLTPMRQRWTRPAKVVAGLVEPTTRVAGSRRATARVIPLPPLTGRRR